MGVSTLRPRIQTHRLNQTDPRPGDRVIGIQPGSRERYDCVMAERQKLMAAASGKTLIANSKWPAVTSVISLGVAMCCILCNTSIWTRAAGGTTTVGGDVVVLVYFATCAAFAGSVFAAFAGWRKRSAVRVLLALSLATSAGAVFFWAQLHLSGTVMEYNAWLLKVKTRR